jgi:hypothetical protein
MKHIGLLIREQRVKYKLFAEYIARSLTKPISKQAFAKKRTGNFSFELVKEKKKPPVLEHRRLLRARKYIVSFILASSEWSVKWRRKACKVKSVLA